MKRRRKDRCRTYNLLGEEWMMDLNGFQIVKDYLEGDPPRDVATGAVQMRMEFNEQGRTV